MENSILKISGSVDVKITPTSVLKTKRFMKSKFYGLFLDTMFSSFALFFRLAQQETSEKNARKLSRDLEI